MNSKIYIGLVGEKGSGKDTFVHFLEKIVKNQSVAHVKSSDLLAETLNIWDLPLTRANLQHVAIVMDQGFGKGTVTSGVAKRMREHPADIVIFDGIRWHTDSEMIKHFEKNMLIYITAPINARFERVKARKEKVGEGEASFEQFLKEEQVETELDIPEIGKGANIIIYNDGTLEEFQTKVEECYKRMVE